MSGLLDVFQGSDAKTETKLPKWIYGPAQDIISQGEQIAAQPYQPYPYARVAPFTGDQTKAFDIMRGAQPSAVSPTTTGPQSVISDAQAYLNPYTEDVINPAIADLQRYVFDPERAAFKAKMHQAGAFGDTGYAQGGDLMERRHEDQAAKFISDMLRSGYTEAIQQAMAGQNQGFNQAFSAQGQSFDQLMRYISGLYGLGQQQQQLGQKSADLAYSDFQKQQEDQRQKLNWLMGILGNAVPTAGGTTTTGGGNNTAADIASLAASLGSYFAGI